MHRTCLAMSLLLTAALIACGDEPSGPDTGAELPFGWTFDSGLDGWEAGTRATGDGGGEVVAANGVVMLSGFGEASSGDAWISRTFYVPPETMSLSFTTEAGCGDGDQGDSWLFIRVTSPDWEGSPLLGSDVIAAEKTTRMLPMNLYAGMTVTLTFEQDDEGEQESSRAEAETVCIDDVVISAEPPIDS